MDGDFELLDRWRGGDRAAGQALFERGARRDPRDHAGRHPGPAAPRARRRLRELVELRDDDDAARLLSSTADPRAA